MSAEDNQQSDQEPTKFIEKLSAGLIGSIAFFFINAFIPILKPFAYGLYTYVVLAAIIGWFIYPRIAASKHPFATKVHLFVRDFAANLVSEFTNTGASNSVKTTTSVSSRTPPAIGMVIERGNTIVVKDSKGNYLDQLSSSIPMQLVGYTHNTVSVKRCGHEVSLYELQNNGKLRFKSKSSSR